jgi:uncharacterized membrane protein
MVTENALLMTQARETLAGKWGTAVKVVLSNFLITSVGFYAVGYLIGFIFNVALGSNVREVADYFNNIASLFIGLPLYVGISIYFLSFSRGTVQELGAIFFAFKSFARYKRLFAMTVTTAIYTFLWTLLLIIPGIRAWCAYSQTRYIFAEDESLTTSELIERSKN